MPPVRFPNANVVSVHHQSSQVSIWTFDLPITLTGANCPELIVTHLGVDHAPTSCSQSDVNIIAATYGTLNNATLGEPWKITALPTNVDVPVTYPANGVLT